MPCQTVLLNGTDTNFTAPLAAMTPCHQRVGGTEPASASSTGCAGQARTDTVREGAGEEQGSDVCLPCTVSSTATLVLPLAKKFFTEGRS